MDGLVLPIGSQRDQFGRHRSRSPQSAQPAVSANQLGKNGQVSCYRRDQESCCWHGYCETAESVRLIFTANSRGASHVFSQRYLVVIQPMDRINEPWLRIKVR